MEFTAIPMGNLKAVKVFIQDMLPGDSDERSGIYQGLMITEEEKGVLKLSCENERRTLFLSLRTERIYGMRIFEGSFHVRIISFRYEQYKIQLHIVYD